MQHGVHRVEVIVKLRSLFDARFTATNIEVAIPIPPAAAKVACDAQAGKAKWTGGKDHIAWKIKKLPGGVEVIATGDIQMISTMGESKPWARPPVALSFKIPGDKLI